MVQAQSPKINEVYTIYKLDATARRVTPATLRTYDDRIAPFIKWCEGQNKPLLTDITPTLLRTYFVSLQERDLSSYTVNGIARALKAFLNFCVKEGLITESPMRRVTVPKVDKKVLPALSPDEVGKLLAVCESERDEALLLFMLDTGIRASELVNLNGQDIDLKTGAVLVRQGKGRKDRLVYLGAKSLKQLLRYYMQRGTPGATDPVWRSERGNERLQTSGLRQLLERLGAKAKVEHVAPHALRRTFALQSLRNGMSIYHLQRLMGHEDIYVLRQYLSLVEGDAKEASEKYGVVDNL